MIFNGQEFKGWLMSEKLDGVRAVWTGLELLSRNGIKFPAPDWFIESLPAGRPLDGELWIGRGRFQEVLAVLKRKIPRDADWREMRFCVFDSSSVDGSFESRIRGCEDLVKNSTAALMIEHRVCRGTADLNDFFREICKCGGEGVMVRRADLAYGRSGPESLGKVEA